MRSRTRWQRIAARTHGYLTPGNAITALGVLLSLAGLFLIFQGRIMFGLFILLFGRIADLLDGFVADRTGTKSHVGEALDAGFDKVIAVAAIVVFLVKHTVPWLPLGVVLAQSVIIVGLGAVAQIRKRHVHPSEPGKYAAMSIWISLFLFVLARGVSAQNVFAADWLQAFGYLWLVLFVLLSIDAVLGYWTVVTGSGSRYSTPRTLQQGMSGWLIRCGKGLLRRKWLLTILGIIFLSVFAVTYLLATSPYSSDTMVKPPFTTAYVDGKVTLTQHYQPHVYSGGLAHFVGIYGKQLTSILWAWAQGPKVPAGNADTIIEGIHRIQFDPNKPYVISGDQFDGLYLRNLGTFYEDLLDPHTARSAEDWHNRQRIAVQTVAYGLSAINQLGRPVTTLMPISAQGVLAVNIYNYPSDTMFSLLATLAKLQADPATKDVATQLLTQYHQGLDRAYRNYIGTVRDSKTGLVRRDIHVSSARDAANRQSSFYDNVILWKTQQLAASLGLAQFSGDDADQLRQTILARFWDAREGHFIDDLASGHEHSYSSDWLIALTTGFLEPVVADDRTRLEKISAYIDKQHIAEPVPIRYANANPTEQNRFVKLFVGSYGGTATWSYWGMSYIKMQIALYQQTGQAVYANHAQKALDAWQRIIVRDRGFPETLDARGNLLVTPFYESIRTNGWVVGYEAAQTQWQAVKGNR